MRTLREIQGLTRRGFTAIPLTRAVPADALTPVAAFLRLSRGHDRSFLLESVEGGERVARFSFLGAGPREIVRIRGGRTSVSGLDGSERPLPGEPLKALAGHLGRLRAPREPGLPRFCGGAVGMAAYELAGLIEPSARLRPPEGDQARLMVFDRAAAFDHVRHEVVLAANVIHEPGRPLARAVRAAEDALEEMRARLGRPAPGEASGGGEDGAAPPFPPGLLGRRRFLEGVRRLKGHIAAGDIFQAVLSERFELPLRARPFSVYRALRRVNPSPYMFFVDMGEETALGASPEMLVRVEGGEVETRPIAGTRPRGRDEREDRALEERLLASVKERAEHLMLVDLGRNDVGRVAAPGSVRVASFMQVERYSHVMHLVSSVRARLRAGATAWDALAACFPAGTVSGAPKIRAMRLLAELEPAPRGLYAGAVVYCDFRGNLDSAIAIRSLLARGRGSRRVARVQAGAGIVADSKAAKEYQEVLDKSRAMMKAIGVAEAGR